MSYKKNKIKYQKQENYDFERKTMKKMFSCIDFDKIDKIKIFDVDYTTEEKHGVVKIIDEPMFVSASAIDYIIDECIKSYEEHRDFTKCSWYFNNTEISIQYFFNEIIMKIRING